MLSAIKDMNIGLLYMFPDPSVESHLVLATAAFAGLTLKRVIIQCGEEKEEKYLKKFPSGKVPAFEQDGFFLTGGTTIAYYLARLAPECGLIPSDMQDAALVDQWISFAEHELDMKIDDLGNEQAEIPMFYVLHLMERGQGAISRLSEHFVMRFYVLGEQLTLADIVITSVLTYGLHKPEKYGIGQYHQRMVEHPKLAPVFSENSLRPNLAAYDRARAIEYPEDDDEWEDKSQSESESLYQHTWRWAI
ncbi:Glutathione S-transferase [Phaffia rhodozyma]|uniref:Glutathione S-transferase n=1 Tax=Phaffia rhodozyma TaxID=264483 RepID=A0A0F7SNL1_PHARH|nr:Glutathione S-transferase [Phaffia rhodozyma]